MSEEEVCSLYKHPQIKAFVAATRGEGYGLPILEAAASGLPVIATNWSGHLDFLSKGKFIPLEYSLENVHPTRVDNRIFMKDSKWAFPKEDDFKKKVVKLKNGYKVPKDWALSLKDKLLAEYSFEEICKKYDEVLGNVII
jgi:glycosyltransferase involved in cell wall biosynthesis